MRLRQPALVWPIIGDARESRQGIVEPPVLEGFSFSADASARFLAEYARRASAGGVVSARKALLDLLAGHPERDWLECGRALVLRSDLETAVAVFSGGLAEHPASSDLRHAFAGVLWQTRETVRAESELRTLLAQHPDHVGATFLLARLLKEQGRMNAVASVVRALFAQAPQPIGLTIQAIELLDDCERKQDAADLCEAAIAHGSTDPRLYAYAGMLELQLGNFARVRERYLFALANSPDALDWQVAIGLAAAQRYENENHPDFERFREGLQRPGLSEKARASLLFALGKAYDDIGDSARAADCFRQGNLAVKGFTDWSRKAWRRTVAARLDAKPLPHRLTRTPDGVPVFVVGMPRSGSTLVAELLSRHPDVRYRGEMTWLPHLAQQLGAAARPDLRAFEHAAETYRTQLRRDDAPARWYIDKQPLNFLHIDLIAALFPNARIVYCERDERDTALSIWMQYFAGHEENFAYDFADIAAVMQGCSRLMASAVKKSALPIRTVRYEELVADTATGIRELAEWLEMPAFDPDAAARDSTISTSSLWQVRQPVYTRSIGRWRAYAPHVPELMQFSSAT
jgi:tetratricopeptide (TPR) repeat protein